MDWSNETYVRVYVRDTVTWKRLGWEGTTVLMQTMRKLDRAGVMDLSGESPEEAIELLTDLPIEIVRVGLERCLKQEVFVLEHDRLLMPNYIPAQETSSSNAQRARVHRAKKSAIKGLKSALRNRNETLRGRNETLRNRNTTLHNATQHNATKNEKQRYTAPDGAESEEAKSENEPSPSSQPLHRGVDVDRLREKRRKKGTRRKKAARDKTPPAEDDHGDVFNLRDPKERTVLVARLEASPKKKAEQVIQRRLLEHIEKEVLRLYREKREELTGSGYVKVQAKGKKNAQQIGIGCIGYGITPQQLLDYWCEPTNHEWANMKFPPLHFLASEKNIDRAACAIRPSKASMRTRGPVAATPREQWTDKDIKDDFGDFVGGKRGK